MRQIAKMLLGVVLLFASSSANAQLPQCDKIYIDKPDLLTLLGLAAVPPQIYTYDPALPASATNPSLNTISFPNGWLIDGGFTVSKVLGSGSNTRTFYSVNINDGKLWYYNPLTLTWVSTGHTMGNAAAVNLGAGGDYIYGLVGATGQIYRYDGTGNGTLLITVNDFVNEGPYDLIADCDGNFYLLNASGENNPPYLRKYSSSGALLQQWAVNNPNGYTPAAGFAIIGNTFYMDEQVLTIGISSGNINNNSIDLNNLTPTPSYGLSLMLDLASCDAAIPIFAEISISAVDTEMCKSHAITLWASTINNAGNAPQYQWFINGVPVPGATDTFYSYVPQNGDEVSCQLTSNKNCVQQTVVMSNGISITVEDPGVAPVLSYDPSEFCIDYPTTISPTINTTGGTFSSTGGLGLDAITGEITASLSAAGEYVVTYTNPPSLLCPPVSTYAVVTVDPLADATINVGEIKKPVCLNDTVVVTAPGNAVFYSWEPSERIIGSSSDPSAIVKLDESSQVILTVIAKGGCKDVDSVYIEGGKSCCKMFVPSAFSPNGDSENDLFEIQYGDVRAITHLSIYNRYGQMIFEAADGKTAWDGTYKDSPCDMGVYFYNISYSCDDGKQKQMKGDITLIR